MGGAVGLCVSEQSSGDMVDSWEVHVTVNVMGEGGGDVGGGGGGTRSALGRGVTVFVRI